MSARRALSLLGTLAGLAACTVGPDYHRPSAPVTAAYKEASYEAPGGAAWQKAAPAAALERGPWWAVYDDPVLSGLEAQVAVSNQTVKAAEAAYRQAQAIVAEARAGYYPTLGLSASGQRSGNGGGRSRSGFTSTGTAIGAGGGQVSNLFEVSADASWAPDLWGRIRRTVESDVASAQVSAADLASAKLSVQGQLAVAYFQLRGADELKRLLDESVAAFARSLQIVRNQHAAGTVTAADVATAETQLKTTQAQAIAVGVQRAQLEHAIAVLTGKPPAALTLTSGPLAGTVPVVPAGLPSALLQRRPDIAAAERQMAAANAEIGIATAAFYPDITLSASGGFSATAIGQLLNASNLLWSFGSSLAETVFDGGLRSATVAAARAGYQQTVANYRQTVLTGFQQVEDQLSALRILAQQAAAEEDALASAREAERLITNQYRAGTVAYTSVIVAQTNALNNAQTALTIRQNRLVASVQLIEALGGGWSAKDLPTPEEVEAAAP